MPREGQKAITVPEEVFNRMEKLAAAKGSSIAGLVQEMAVSDVIHQVIHEEVLKACLNGVAVPLHYVSYWTHEIQSMIEKDPALPSPLRERILIAVLTLSNSGALPVETLVWVLYRELFPKAWDIIVKTQKEVPHRLEQELKRKDAWTTLSPFMELVRTIDEVGESVAEFSKVFPDDREVQRFLTALRPHMNELKRVDELVPLMEEYFKLQTKTGSYLKDHKDADILLGHFRLWKERRSESSS